jgi:type IV pilus assembly protein PilW
VGYAIRNGNLTMCDYYSAPAFAPVPGLPAAIPATPGVDCSLPGNWVSIASNIVSLRAQYGRDTAGAGTMDGIVDVYDQALPANPPPVAPVAPATTFCAWTRITALRFVLVARSVQYEALNGVPTLVTQQAPTWDGAAGNPINLISDPNWMSYRYKTFQTTVPLRNSSWMGVGPGQTTPSQSVLQSSGASC